ncbi:hypothetical protein CK203_063060 [Vitis vinifera]|uniref:DUF4283 domain-containing protein n=1 Tax=Vitis vinifera TaxID=29760 RepID=A0A438G613_VITVI|nr:hypothetical protein CK203_063060 [Vitis vinifera]
MKVGGRAWFGVESKSFEILVELSKGKLFGFGERGLSLLLEGVEDCCQKESSKEFKNSKVEGGRSYKLQLCNNEGKGFPRGWFVLAQKLRAYLVEHRESRIEAFKFGGVNLFNKMQYLNRCLVGKWGEDMEEGPLISSLEGWARYHWRLKGNLSLLPLGGSWILFEFKLAREAEKALQEGLSVFRQRPLKLERWSPTICCLMGDACGGYVGVDKETARVNLWWEIPPWVASVVPRAESQEEGEKKGSDTRATSRMGLAGSNLAEKVSLPGKMRLVEEATLLVSFEGRLQQEV